MVALVFFFHNTPAWALAPLSYRLSFSTGLQRSMYVELTLRNLPASPLELRLSHTSPGRYALHDFAQNVHDVRAVDVYERELTITHPSSNAWTIATHPSSLTVRYRVSGDRLDGTWFDVTEEHAHLNMPSVLLWVRGLEERSATVHFELPTGARWNVATQLFPTSNAHTFTAPNLQYLLDSPVELSAFSERTFTVEDGTRRPTFRLVVHHRGNEDEVSSLANATQSIVREARQVFGRFPAFEGRRYTFLVDALPSARNDGMEHRNSAVITTNGSLATTRGALLEALSHEFFHAWNVERIRPRSLEPFHFERANVSSELWLAEGFTEYYGPLVLRRAGLSTLDGFARNLAATISRVRSSPAINTMTVEESSRLAPIVDGSAQHSSMVRNGSYLSYYFWGQAIALALDLSLRERSNHRRTLDHVMQGLWQRFGTSGERVPGYVLRPYTLADVRAVLASVAGDRAFAANFIRRFVQGHDLADYRRLLALAGLALEPALPQSNNAPAFTLVPVETTGVALTPEQRSFRRAWLGER